MKALDDEDVVICPTDDTEQEMREAEEVYKKIVESLATTDSVKMNAAVKQKDKGPSNGQ